MAAAALNLTSLISPVNLLQKTQAKPQATTGSTTSSSSSGGLTGTSTGTTFLNLLVKELQNQDPDSPVDSTQMVGQMISLNQLDQLISINQTLSTATGSTSAGATSSGANGYAITGSPAVSSSAQMEQRAALMNSLQNTNSAQAAQQSIANPNQILDLSNLNIPNGGK